MKILKQNLINVLDHQRLFDKGMYDSNAHTYQSLLIRRFSFYIFSKFFGIDENNVRFHDYKNPNKKIELYISEILLPNKLPLIDMELYAYLNKCNLMASSLGKINFNYQS